MDFYCSVRPELGAVEELRLSAFDRRHLRLSASYIDAFQGHVLNFTHFGSEFVPKTHLKNAPKLDPK